MLRLPGVFANKPNSLRMYRFSFAVGQSLKQMRKFIHFCQDPISHLFNRNLFLFLVICVRSEDSLEVNIIVIQTTNVI